MTTERRPYALGTFLTQSFPWGTYSLPGRALCSDGKVRALARIAITADTFFSVPSAVKVAGRTVSGFVTTDDDDEGNVSVRFIAYSYGRNGHLLPGTKVAS
jgi:hypothetical protein